MPANLTQDTIAGAAEFGFAQVRGHLKRQIRKGVDAAISSHDNDVAPPPRPASPPKVKGPSLKTSKVKPVKVKLKKPSKPKMVKVKSKKLAAEIIDSLSAPKEPLAKRAALRAIGIEEDDSFPDPKMEERPLSDDEEVKPREAIFISPTPDTSEDEERGTRITCSAGRCIYNRGRVCTKEAIQIHALGSVGDTWAATSCADYQPIYGGDEPEGFGESMPPRGVDE